MDERAQALAAMQQATRPGPGTTPLIGALRTGPDTPPQRIGKKEIAKAIEDLTLYKQGKANLEKRIVEDELWYKMRHWDVIRRTERVRKLCCPRDAAGNPVTDTPAPEPSSAWLFNAILSKHADAMDNYPEAVVLPREQSDEGSAKVLSSVLPTVMELNDFSQVYSDAWWEKLKHGTACYGVFWDSSKENGLGDIAVKEIDLLRVFWEPGITDIQRSRNLFIVDLVDTDLLDAQYPQYAGKLGGNVVDLTQYVYDDAVDTSKKSLVVDWYYKRRQPSGRTVLQYCKFVGDTVLYASENEPEYAERGYYDHGQYPIVMDTLYPEEGTPVGFGYVSICKDPQMYIDKLYSNILEYSLKATRPRWMASTSAGINEAEYKDWSKPVVHVEGSLDDNRMRQITLDPISGIYVDVLGMKIDEMKETSANRDVTNGGAGSGVTAASAIAALQEAGNKASRDMISASYRAHTSICKLCIELMRQFYDETRSFRIVGDGGTMQFIQFSGAAIREQPMGFDAAGMELYRLPVFDLKISAQKKNPFSRMEANERAKELYAMGFFDPNRAQEALIALDMMDFEGIDKVREKVLQGQTLYNLAQQQAAVIAQLTGDGLASPAAPVSSGGQASTPPQGSGGQSASQEIMAAQAPQSGYTQRLVERSRPSIEAR